jgi:CRP-like cAMP-binding protein
LLDVGSELALDEGVVLVEPGTSASGIFLILHGVVRVETPIETIECGPGQIVGEWEKLDGSEDVRVTAQTEVRLVAIDRAAYEAALTG